MWFLFLQVGTLVFGIIIQTFLDSYGWQYTLIINGGICLVVGVGAGALFRPLPKRKPEVEDEKSGAKDAESDSSEDEIDERTLLHASPSMKRLYYGGGDSQSACSDSSFPKFVAKPEKTPLVPEVVTSDAPTAGCYCCCCGPCNSPFCRIVGEIFDPTLFKNPIFVIFAIVLVFFSFGYHTPYTYVPERAQHLGISARKSSLLISIMGVSNVAARLIFGWIADRSPGIRFYFAGIVFILGGFFTMLVFLYVTYPAMVTFSILFGACSGELSDTCFLK